MTNETNKYIEEVLSEFDKRFKCIDRGCDGSGNLPYQVDEGVWEADQCQFHAEYLIPMRKLFEQALLKQQEIIKECYDNSVTYEGFVDKLKARGINLE